jgi:hypothetical protein
MGSRPKLSYPRSTPDLGVMHCSPDGDCNGGRIIQSKIFVKGKVLEEHRHKLHVLKSDSCQQAQLQGWSKQYVFENNQYFIKKYITTYMFIFRFKENLPYK